MNIDMYHAQSITKMREAERHRLAVWAFNRGHRFLLQDNEGNVTSFAEYPRRFQSSDRVWIQNFTVTPSALVLATPHNHGAINNGI